MDRIIKVPAIVSPQWELKWVDIKKIIKDAAIFLAAPILMYLFSIQSIVTTPSHIVTQGDFVPTPVVIGGITAWFISIAINTLQKWGKEKVNVINP